jgi:hypothetical protein
VKAKTPQPAAASREPAEMPSLPHGDISVSNRLLTVPENERAADLFSRILASVRSATARRKEHNRNGWANARLTERD